MGQGDRGLAPNMRAGTWIRRRPAHRGQARHPAAEATDAALALYQIQLDAQALLANGAAASASLSPSALATLYATGLLTSFSPCALSALPLTFGLLGALDDGAAANATATIGAPATTKLASAAAAGPALAYAAGLSLALAALGASAALLGRIYGSQAGAAASALPLAAAILTTGMGLNLLELLPFSLPSLELRLPDGVSRLPVSAQALLLGASAALLSSPCTSPVLATLLSLVATTGEPTTGFVDLLAYTAGFTSPVLATGLALTSAKSMARAAGRFTLLPQLSGSVLLAIGVYSSLNIVSPV